MNQIFCSDNFFWKSKVAVFDYDWTLVKPKEGRTFPTSVHDWQFFNDTVLTKLHELVDTGFCIVLISNQSKPWKLDQIKEVVKVLGLECLCIVAYEKPDYKPSTNLWDSVKTNDINYDSSLFVGDALGRQQDFSNSDLKFAENAGFKQVYSPEHFFVGTTNVVKVNVPFKKPDHQDLVILVGYPGSGKSTFADTLKSMGPCVILKGDELKTPAKISKALKMELQKGPRGPRVVIDATNPTKEHRARYVQIAKDFGLHDVKCVWISTDITESMSRNSLRPQDRIVPKVVFYVFRKKFEEPKADEGIAVYVV